MREIPVTAEPERYTNSAFEPEEFVELVSDRMIDIRMQYPLLGMKQAEPRCFMRKGAYERLLKAALLLPEGYRLRVWDAWRPFALQHELYFEYADDIIREFELENCTEEEKKAVIRKFVSDPVEDRAVPPVHTTGGAVDVTILNQDGKELEMGSAFDEFSHKTYTAFYEDEKNKEARENRRLLYNIMTEAGFINLPSEWWHYDYGDRFWAFYMKKPAIYKGVFTREEINGIKVL